ncbi:hypothetical protein DSO57_1000089 [Entomophthora muscae]|uniref:Uncharacterized protein n=1 Tax=Entomophthora muscae TaxID=34485 RepID=A0ACC2SML4_9FUNG|nr:hypothetical protein DSO57_1000089 [Entomophthora muscae]
MLLVSQPKWPYHNQLLEDYINPQQSLGHKRALSESFRPQLASDFNEKAFEDKALEINILYDAGDLEAAKERLRWLVSAYDPKLDSFKSVNYLLSRFLTCPFHVRDPTKLQHFQEFCRSKFFLSSCRDDQVWKAVVHDIIIYATKERLFSQLNTFGLEFRNCILAIASTMHQTAAERFILNILDQVEPELKARAFTATICFLNSTSVPSTLADFPYRLLKRMKEENLAPSADAYAAAMSLWLSHLSFTPTVNTHSVASIMEIYEEFRATGYSLKENDAVLLCKRLCQATTFDATLVTHLINATLGLIQGHHKLSPDLSKRILSLLLNWNPSTNVDPVMDCNPVKLLAAWKRLAKDETINKQHCFYVLLGCFSTALKGCYNSHSMVKETFQKFILEQKPKDSLPFTYYIHALSNVGSTLRLCHIMQIMKQHGVEPDTAILNALLSYYTAAKNYAGAVRCTKTLTDVLKSERERPYPPITPNSESLSLIFGALCREGSFWEAQRVCERFFELTSTTPCSQREYQSIMVGLNQIFAFQGTSAHHQRWFRWANKRIDHIIQGIHSKDFKCSVSLLTQFAVRASATYVKALTDPSATVNAHRVLMLKFDSLVVDHVIQLDSTTYSFIFSAMANVVLLEPRKTKNVLTHLDRVYDYMLASGTKLYPNIFSSLFILFQRSNEPARLEAAYEKFLDMCQSMSFPETPQTTVAFNTYIMARPISSQDITAFLHKVMVHGGYPDEHTFIQLFKNLERQQVGISELQSCLGDIESHLSLWRTQLNKTGAPQLDITVLLVGTVARIFKDTAGPGEMSKAAKSLIASAKTNKLLLPLPSTLFSQLATWSLMPFEGNSGQDAVYWLERLAESIGEPKRTKELKDVFASISDADPSVALALAKPEVQERLNSIRQKFQIQ